MTPQQQEGYRALAQVEGDGSPNLPGPLKIWVNNPNLALAVAPLAAPFRPPHHSLSQREREIAVCVITGKWHAPYLINAHTEIAITLGLPGDMVNALACGLPASFATDASNWSMKLQLRSRPNAGFHGIFMIARSRRSATTGSRT